MSETFIARRRRLSIPNWERGLTAQDRPLDILARVRPNVELQPKSPTAAGAAPVPVVDRMKYGDPINMTLNIGTVNQAVLAAATSRRTFLAIFNNHAVQNMFLVFGGEATTVVGMRIPAGGSIFFDAFVPQGEVNLIASAAGTDGVLAYAEQPE